MFTSEKALLGEIANELSSCGCCSRCTMRYLGDKDMHTYRGNYKDMAEMVQDIRGKSSVEQPDIDKNGKTVDTSETTNKCDIDSQKSVSNSTNTPMETDDSSNCKTDSAFELNGNGEDCDTADGSKSNTQSHSSNTSSACVICLGILEQFAEEKFLNKRAILLHLKEKFRTVYGDKTDMDIAPIKDVWKWRNGPLLTDLLGAPFSPKSMFDITMTFDYTESNKECTFLLSSSCSEMFVKRKHDRRFRKKLAQSLYTRANVGKALDKLSDDEFRKSYQCPPLAPKAAISCDIKCQNENVFVAGRYNKYSRELSQTPWLIDGVRRSESSVEELLCGPINKHFRPDEQKFSSSGREDVDVRMLGNGRPFVLELINPRCRNFSSEQMAKMQQDINTSTEDIKCRDLQIVPKEETEVLKQGEIDKVKWYRALCWSEQPVSQQHLDTLNSTKELKILQKTPIRVLHRRPLATRDKLIHSMSATRVDDTHFSVDLSTQAGTYIKEFVHGDLGRTRPNLSIILGIDVDILDLDVTAIELDWPKAVDQDREQELQKPQTDT
ncbi:tRNA pseudouridine synthase Pus10-like isoform X2 [Mya arenaria]|uniref:tRNA pseudouridine synthase Pus10-like isoform X2 n=1 Tax=Mya arenaria TaxID=6604 RepID=UPI0022E97019|nr:tRNA pseudouridine synthase Pus10-like isoform X2 [Mya arenaria]